MCACHSWDPWIQELKAAQRVCLCAGYPVEVRVDIWVDVRGQQFGQALEILNNWEEPSIDQCQSRGKLLTNFEGHWSIRISLKTRQKGHWSIRTSPEIHMSSKSVTVSESSGLHRYRSIKCSSLSKDIGVEPLWTSTTRRCRRP